MNERMLRSALRFVIRIIRSHEGHARCSLLYYLLRSFGGKISILSTKNGTDKMSRKDDSRLEGLQTERVCIAPLELTAVLDSARSSALYFKTQRKILPELHLLVADQDLLLAEHALYGASYLG